MGRRRARTGNQESSEAAIRRATHGAAYWDSVLQSLRDDAQESVCSNTNELKVQRAQSANPRGLPQSTGKKGTSEIELPQKTQIAARNAEAQLDEIIAVNAIYPNSVRIRHLGHLCRNAEAQELFDDQQQMGSTDGGPVQRFKPAIPAFNRVEMLLAGGTILDFPSPDIQKIQSEAPVAEKRKAKSKKKKGTVGLAQKKDCCSIGAGCEDIVVYSVLLVSDPSVNTDPSASPSEWILNAYKTKPGSASSSTAAGGAIVYAVVTVAYPCNYPEETPELTVVFSYPLDEDAIEIVREKVAKLLRRGGLLICDISEEICGVLKDRLALVNSRNSALWEQMVAHNSSGSALKTSSHAALKPSRSAVTEDGPAAEADNAPQTDSVGCRRYSIALPASGDEEYAANGPASRHSEWELRDGSTNSLSSNDSDDFAPIERVMGLRRKIAASLSDATSGSMSRTCSASGVDSDSGLASDAVPQTDQSLVNAFESDSDLSGVVRTCSRAAVIRGLQSRKPRRKIRSTYRQHRDSAAGASHEREVRRPLSALSATSGSTLRILDQFVDLQMPLYSDENEIGLKSKDRSVANLHQWRSRRQKRRRRHRRMQQRSKKEDPTFDSPMQSTAAPVPTDSAAILDYGSESRSCLSRYSKDFEEIFVENICPALGEVITRSRHKLDRHTYSIRHIVWPVCPKVRIFSDQLMVTNASGSFPNLYDAGSQQPPSLTQIGSVELTPLQRAIHGPERFSVNEAFSPIRGPGPTCQAVLTKAKQIIKNLYAAFSWTLYREIMSQVYQQSRITHGSIGRVFQGWLQKASQTVVGITKQSYFSIHLNSIRDTGYEPTPDFMMRKLALKNRASVYPEYILKGASKRFAQGNSAATAFSNDPAGVAAAVESTELHHRLCNTIVEDSDNYEEGRQNIAETNDSQVPSSRRTSFPSNEQENVIALSLELALPKKARVLCLQTEHHEEGWQTLHRLIEMGKLGPEHHTRNWLIFRAVLEPLLVCHRQGVATLDLRPSTIAVGNFSSSSEPQIRLHGTNFPLYIRREEIDFLRRVRRQLESMFSEGEQQKSRLRLALQTEASMRLASLETYGYYICEDFFDRNFLAIHETARQTLPEDVPALEKQLEGIELKCDIYALGMLLFEIFHRPFRSGPLRFNALRRLATRFPPPTDLLNALENSAAASLIVQLLNPDPEKRPTIAQLLFDERAATLSVGRALVQKFVNRLENPDSTESRTLMKVLFERKIAFGATSAFYTSTLPEPLTSKIVGVANHIPVAPDNLILTLPIASASREIPSTAATGRQPPATELGLRDLVSRALQSVFESYQATLIILPVFCIEASRCNCGAPVCTDNYEGSDVLRCWRRLVRCQLRRCRKSVAHSLPCEGQTTSHAGGGAGGGASGQVCQSERKFDRQSAAVAFGGGVNRPAEVITSLRTRQMLPTSLLDASGTVLFLTTDLITAHAKLIASLITNTTLSRCSIKTSRPHQPGCIVSRHFAFSPVISNEGDFHGSGIPLAGTCSLKTADTSCHPGQRLRALFSSLAFQTSMDSVLVSVLDQLVFEADHVVASIDAVSTLINYVQGFVAVWTYRPFLTALLTDVCLLNNPIRSTVLRDFFLIRGICWNIWDVTYLIFLAPEQTIRQCLSLGLPLIVPNKVQWKCIIDAAVLVDPERNVLDLFELLGKRALCIRDVLLLTSPSIPVLFPHADTVVAARPYATGKHQHAECDEEIRNLISRFRPLNQVRPAGWLDSIVAGVAEFLVSDRNLGLRQELSAMLDDTLDDTTLGEDFRCASSAAGGRQITSRLEELAETLSSTEKISSPTSVRSKWGRNLPNLGPLIEDLKLMEAIFASVQDSGKTPISVVFDACMPYDSCNFNDGRSLAFHISCKGSGTVVASGGAYDSLIVRKSYQISDAAGRKNFQTCGQSTAAAAAISETEPLLVCDFPCIQRYVVSHLRKPVKDVPEYSFCNVLTDSKSTKGRMPATMCFGTEFELSRLLNELYRCWTLQNFGSNPDCEQTVKKEVPDVATQSSKLGHPKLGHPNMMAPWLGPRRIAFSQYSKSRRKSGNRSRNSDLTSQTSFEQPEAKDFFVQKPHMCNQHLASLADEHLAKKASYGRSESGKHTRRSARDGDSFPNVKTTAPVRCTTFSTFNQKSNLSLEKSLAIINTPRVVVAIQKRATAAQAICLKENLTSHLQVRCDLRIGPLWDTTNFRQKLSLCDGILYLIVLVQKKKSPAKNHLSEEICSNATPWPNSEIAPPHQRTIARMEHRSRVDVSSSAIRYKVFCLLSDDRSKVTVIDSASEVLQFLSSRLHG